MGGEGDMNGLLIYIISTTHHKSVSVKTIQQPSTNRTFNMSALTPSQVQTIKSTVPVLAEYGAVITTKFYEDTLIAHP